MPITTSIDYQCAWGGRWQRVGLWAWVACVLRPPICTQRSASRPAMCGRLPLWGGLTSEGYRARAFQGSESQAQQAEDAAATGGRSARRAEDLNPTASAQRTRNSYKGVRFYCLSCSLVVENKKKTQKKNKNSNNYYYCHCYSYDYFCWCYYYCYYYCSSHREGSTTSSRGSTTSSTSPKQDRENLSTCETKVMRTISQWS